MFTNSDWIFAIILILEVAAFYYFYSHSEGVRAIYFTWYAWIIDVLAIFSGCILMSMGIFAGQYPFFFSETIPQPFIMLIFIIGSWQASIHAVKLYLRTFDRERIRKIRAKLAKKHSH